MPSTDPRSRRPGHGLDAGEVRDALKARAEELFRAAFGEPDNPRAHEWRDRKGKISMEMQGEKRGVWNDFSGEGGGDLFDLVAVTRFGLLKAEGSFPKVLEEAARMCGIGKGREAWRGFPKDRPAQEIEAARAREDRKKRDWNAAKVMAVIAGIRPAEGTPAAAYLAGRGVTDLPKTGLGWLPGSRDLPFRNRRVGALLVWAIGDSGWPTGGQRILVTPKGRPSGVKPRKSSFGQVGGSPARFPARPGKEAEPLVVAEGPESALSVRQVTGLECWAVFGVTNFKSAPLPAGRTVILAPDRDGRDSKAGREFRRAVFVQRKHGVDLLVADAPEKDGSGKDLNDTLRRKGEDAVRAAIEAARPVTDADLEEAET